jgi:Protein of unknown function (DUF3866)
MALSLRRGTVTAVRERLDDLDRIEVDGAPCVSYPGLTGPVEEGDEVLVNVQARELGLGSGGFDILHANLTRGLELPPEAGAHVMKLPYTPMQFAVRHGEEDAELPATLDGLPVVGCSLHSQLAPVCAALDGSRVAYVQLQGGALPLGLSDTLRVLRGRSLLHVTIGAGACFGGDVDAVSVYSALALARARGAEVIVAGIGPGVVGTASSTGHGGTAAAAGLLAAAALGGRGVLALRVSQADLRERHRGVSHHSVSVLSLLSGNCVVAWPAGCPLGDPPESAVEVDVTGWEAACSGLPLSHMGRGPDDDPWFFAAAFAAGRLARGMLG